MVEINGSMVAGFSEVGGIESRTEVDDFHEGGVNSYVHKIARETKFPNLVLKRGVTEFNGLWDWCQKVANGEIERRTISVVVLDAQQNEKFRWIFAEAFPVKWSGSDLNATNNAILMESLELAHHGMSKQ